MSKHSEEAIGLYFYLLDKLYQKLLSHDLSLIGIERYFSIIWLIAHNQEPLSQQNLAKLLKVDKANVVRIIDELEAKGYVKRILNPNDKRAYFLVLDYKGKQHIEAIRQAIKNINEEMFFNFSRQEKETFLVLLRKAYQNLSSEPQSDLFLKFLKDQ